MDPLTAYYVRQAGYGYGSDPIWPVYSSSPFVQRGYGIGSFLTGLYRMVRPYVLRGAKFLGRGALRTGGKILSGIADNREPGVGGVGDIVSRNLAASAQYMFNKLRGTGRKRVVSTRRRATKGRRKKQTSAKRKPSIRQRRGTKRKRAPLNKSDIFS